MKLTIFTQPGCQPCMAQKRWWNARGIPYEAIDVSADPEAIEMVKGLGYQKAPVTLVTDDHGNIIDHWHGLIIANLTKYTLTEQAA